MSESVDGKNSSSSNVSKVPPDGTKVENRWRAVLTKPISSWVIALGVVVLVVVMLVQVARQRAEMATKWDAEDRSPVESLKSFQKLWLSCDRDAQNALLESRLLLVQISREAGISRYPGFPSAVSGLANIKVLRGESDEAMTLYEEARQILSEHLESGHPDIIQIEQNISLARELQSRSHALCFAGEPSGSEANRHGVPRWPEISPRTLGLSLEQPEAS